jgi:DNA-binding CsgD family transcriptional regulator
MKRLPSKKQPDSLSLGRSASLISRLAAFLALLGYFFIYYLSFTLFDFLPHGSGGITVLAVYILNFAGIVLGSVLCPLAMKIEGTAGKGNRSLAVGLGFIALIMIPQIVVRSLGVRIWFGYLSALATLAISSGILHTVVHGLFFLSFTSQNQRSYRTLFLAFAMSCGILVRHFSTPLLEITGLDPPSVISLLVNIIKWFAVCTCALCGVCFVMLRHRIPRHDMPPHDIPPHDMPPQQERVTKTDWQMIARLVGLSVIFSLINAVMETGLTPFMGGIAARQYSPHVLTAVVVVCLFAFIATRSMGGFLRWFLAFAITLFILLPCLVLFEEYPGFMLLMSTLVFIFRFSAWIIFTVAVVECYAGGFWLYGLASVIHFSNVLSFLGPVINRILPAGMGFTVLMMGISATAFMFLAFRIMFPKILPQEAAVPNGTQSLDIEAEFRERKLTEREAEVARLIVKKGLGNKDIGKELDIAEVTVEKNVTAIYRKFKVRSRMEFVSLFYNQKANNNEKIAAYNN